MNAHMVGWSPADTASVERSGAGGGTEARYPQTGGFATNESARQAFKADTHRQRSNDGYRCAQPILQSVLPGVGSR